MSEFPKQIPGWLVWSGNKDGSTALRAVDTTEKMAKLHEKAIISEGRAERVFIERTRLNHLYFGMFEHGAPDPEKVKKALADARKKHGWKNPGGRGD